MSQPIQPTCDDLFEGELGAAVYENVNASWRHGVIRTEVFRRESDDTFWRAVYRGYKDGETNGLREGTAWISQVWPHQVMATAYKPEPPA